MSFKTTIALLALLLIVAAYFVVLEVVIRPGQERQHDADAAGLLLAPGSVPEDDVAMIDLERGGQALRLQRQRDGWRQTEPVRFMVREAVPVRLIHAVSTLRLHRWVEPGAGDIPSAAAMRLDPPRATLRLHWRNGGAGARELGLHIGDRLTDGRAFVRIEGQQRVGLVSGRLIEMVLRADARSWRPERLGELGIPAARHASVVALADREKQILLQREAGRWQFAGGDPVDSARIDRLLEAMSAIGIREYLSDDPAALPGYGLDRPWRMVQIQRPDPALTGPDEDIVLTLRIGHRAAGREGGYYASFSDGREPSPVVFRLSQSQVEALDIDPDQMRNPRLVRLPLATVHRIAWEKPREAAPQPPRWEITRRGEHWQFTDGDPGFEPGNPQVFRLVSALLAAEARAYHHASRPQEPPVRRVTVAGLMDDEVEQLAIYPMPDAAGDDEDALPVPAGAAPIEPDRKWLVYRQDERTGYIVAAEDLEPLFDPIVALRSRQVLALQEEDVAAVTIHRPDGAALRFTARREGRFAPVQWKLEGHDGHDDRTRRRLFEQLFALTTPRWLDEPAGWEPDGQQGVFRIELKLTDERRRELLVDPRRGLGLLDGRQAMALPERFIEHLESELRDRDIIPLGRGDLLRLAIHEPGEDEDEPAVTLTLRDRRIASDDEGVDHDAALRLLDVLAPLRIERYIDTAPPEATPLRRLELHARPDRHYTVQLLDPAPLARVNGQVVQLDERTWQRLQEPLLGR